MPAVYTVLSPTTLTNSPVPQPRDLKAYGVILCAITFLLQAYVYYRFGGISGFIRTFGSTRSGEASEFLGLGWLFTLAESFPVLFVILCTALAKRQLRRARPLTLLLYLSASAPLVLLFGGLRGSRGNTIYTMVYILGIIHLTVRPLSRGSVALYAAFLLLFMYIYGFYKSSPDLFFDPASLVYRVASADSRAHLEKTTGRSLQTVLIGDLDRSDVQAYLLFRTTHPASDVKLAYGRTYVDGALAFVPYRLSHYRPPGKLQYGTNAMYGEGTY